MGLAAGSLNRWITVEQRAAGNDAANRPNGAWELFVGLWCNIRGATGASSIRQADTDGVSRAVAQYSFRVRYRADLTAEMRVVRNGEYFDIVGIRHDLENNDWTDIVCEVGGNDG